MPQLKKTALGLALAAMALTWLACSEGAADAMLGGGGSGAMLRFAEAGEIPMVEGLSLGADPRQIELDPCDLAAPIDPDSGLLLGTATIGALLLDSELMPIAGAEVLFSSSAGALLSDGEAVLTDANGLATDTLTVDEADAGDVVVTVISGSFGETIVVPVVRIPKPPIVLGLSPDELWPPNHRLQEVTASFDGIECYPGTSFQLVSVTSDEPDNGLGDGDTENDIQGVEPGTPDTTLLLRAERAGGGDGRVYTVLYDLIDDEGNVTPLEGSVMVPHDQGG